MKRKRTSIQSSTTTNSYLPDECWERIFKFIFNDDENNDRHYFYPLNSSERIKRKGKGTSVYKSSRLSISSTYSDIPEDIFNDDDPNNRNICRYLNSLSLVSKQLLSITNQIRSSLTILNPTHPFLCRLFKRFTNLNSLNLTRFHGDLDALLRKISRFSSLNITSLNLSNQPTVPANGLRAFSQKNTTLTSLTCSHIANFNSSDLFLIAECFPLLEELDISYCECCYIYPIGYHTKYYKSCFDGVEALSLALFKLRKVNLSSFPINNLSLFHLFHNCKLLEEVIMFSCDPLSGLTFVGITSALRERPTLRSFSFSPPDMKDEMFVVTQHFIDSIMSLKGLTCLDFQFMNISNNLFYCIAREGLPLTRFALRHCFGPHSYAGIFRLLSKCQGIQHLDLELLFLNDQHVLQLSSFLSGLMSINLSCCLKLTKLALYALTRNCPLLSEIKMEGIGKSMSVENSEKLVEVGVYPQLKSLYLGKNQWLSDEGIIMFASNFPNLQLLDLNCCNLLSKGICQVLRICCKIRHLNLAYCKKVKLLGMNFVVPNLEVLNLSNTKVNDKTLYMISKNCCGLLQLLLELCHNVTEEGVKHVVENCTQLREHGYLLY
ncbi:putative leucine-rich repeat domain, L domain-containing protein [Medicago truncatula]|uniref:F-box/LRR protein, putative n=1 Tax=Medicago truncatula TaxID=3880 RepID=G7IX94_MEDTR|nr:F-box/LRR-repeat protein 3 [Medicago truncatula]AES69870.1 F-box/LRR protein, putative [Medicago truncatula]RHN66449.1 putative leucine-rich repeat domain, L domain-containing protein [Medicago truncatula]